MKIAVEDFEKIVNSPNFLHLTSTNWLFLKIDRKNRNNYNKLMKTLICPANKSVPRYMTYYSEG